MKLHRRGSQFVVLLLLVLGTVRVGWAQMTTGAIDGTVVDQSAAALPGAAITVTDEATGRTRTTTSSPQGFFRLDSLPPGAYTVRAELHGFKPGEYRGVVLAGTKVVTVTLSLGIASGAEQVDVLGEAPLVNVTQDQLKTQVDSQMMHDLPISTRRFQDLALLVAGVNLDLAASQGGTSDPIAFFGFDERNKALYVDGVDLNDELTRGGTVITNAPRNEYSMEVIEDMEVLQNQFSAEVGRAQAGVINIITRSGTNDFHGTAFFLDQSDAFGSKNVFSSGKIPFSLKQFGANLGGPIVKDKTHFFLSYERSTQTKVSTISIPPALLPILPDPRTEIPQDEDHDNVFAKLTHNLSPSNVLNFSYNFNHKIKDGQSAGPNAAANARFSELRSDHLLIARLTSTLGSRATNEIRASYSHTDTNRPVAVNTPGLVFPSLNVGTPSNLPQGRMQNNYILKDVYTGQFSGAGEHALRVGAGMNIVRYPTQLNLFQFGRFTFAKDEPPGPNNPPILYILGQYNSQYAHLDGNYFDGFVQDDWRVTPRLTLNLGLRYDLETFSGSYSGADYPPFTNQAQGVQFLLTTLPGGAHATTIYRSRNTDHGEIQPRIGFNWAATNDGRTSVRGGYGIFYEGGQDPISVEGTLAQGRAQTYVAPGKVFPLLSFYPNMPPPDLLNRFFRISLISQFPGVFVQSAYAHQFTIGAERQLPGDISIAVDYAGIRSRHNPHPANVNHPATPGSGASVLNGQYPYGANYGPVTVDLSDGVVNTDAVMVQIRRQFSRRVGLLIGYTFLKANQDGPSSSPYLLAQDYGPTPNDIRHHLSASIHVRLPWELEVAGIVTASSAFPYNELAGTDVTGDGDPTNDRPPGVTYDSLRGDRYFDADLRVSKNVKFGRRYTIQVIAEAFNLFNTTNYNNYIGTVTSPLFQKPVQAMNPFQAQLGARFSF